MHLEPLQPQTSVTWGASMLDHDHFTYTDQPREYWSGYFSTRPYLKKLIRTTGNAIRAARTAFALGRTAPHIKQDATWWQERFRLLQNGARQVALLQHHDGITGTCRIQVANDYTDRLVKALADASQVLREVTARLAASEHRELDNEIEVLDQWVPQRNKDDSPLQEFRLKSSTNQVLPVVIFNPSSHERQEIVRLRVDSCLVRVVDASTKRAVPSQLVPHLSMAPDGSLSASSAGGIVMFVAQVPPLGFATYHISLATADQDDLAYVSTVFTKGIRGAVTFCGVPAEALTSSTTAIDNEYHSVVVSLETGLPVSVTQARSSNPTESIKLEQTYSWYSSRGGSYLFVPTDTATPLPIVRRHGCFDFGRSWSAS